MSANSKIRLVHSFALVSLLVLSGCTWVQPIDTSTSVALASASDVAGCNRLGTTTSTVRDQIGWFSRGEEKVAEELLTLAQNAAFEMGGNTLVATAEPRDGSQQFVIYSCTAM
jgi:hypothetical protein